SVTATSGASSISESVPFSPVIVISPDFALAVVQALLPSATHFLNVNETPFSRFGSAGVPVSALEAHCTATLPSVLATLRVLAPPLPLKRLPLPIPSRSSYLPPPCTSEAASQFLAE